MLRRSVSTDLLLQIKEVDQILLVIVCIVSGIILRKTFTIGEEGPRVLNNLIIYFFIPIITLLHVPVIEFKAELIWLTVAPFIIFTCSFIFFQLFDKIQNLGHDTKLALILTSGIGSTSFVGFPIFEMLYGAEGLAYGVFLSVGGTILVFNTVGLFTLFYHTEQNLKPYRMIKKLLFFFPFVTFLFAIILNIFSVGFPPYLIQILKLLVQPFSVIAFISIGMQIKFTLTLEFTKYLLLGQFFKLILSPLIIFCLLYLISDTQNTIAKVCILGAAIGSMNAMSIITAEKNISPKLAIMMPAIGIPISIPILFIIHRMLT